MDTNNFFYSVDYSLQSFIEFWHLNQEEVDALIKMWYTKERILQTIMQILLED